MTTDLWMLTWTALLSFAFPYVYAAGRFQSPGGFGWGFSNRDQPLEVVPWVGRAVRAHQNLVENIGPFAILVLVAHVAGKANELTAVGATIFFWARLAHALAYIAGILYLRTAVFFVGFFGELLILSQLFA
jgi:uncharacterized MAPEG superfamily protein